MSKSLLFNIFKKTGIGKVYYQMLHRPCSYLTSTPMVVDLLTGNPDIILSTYRALGDTLLLSAVASELHKRSIARITIASVRSELFVNNPHIYNLWNKDDWHCKQLRDRIPKLKFCHYSVHTDTPGKMKSPSEHIIAVMCRQAGLRGKVDLLPRIHLNAAEIEKFSRVKECIVVQSSIANAGYPILNKEWYPERMQSFVNHINKHFEVVQLGVASDPPLDNVTDLRGSVTVRQAAAILKNSRAFVGMVGFLMHLARAVDCPSVIVYGGREEPWQSGYSCNENLYTPLACAPCWREDICPYNRECMQAIRSIDVRSAFERLLSGSSNLAVDTAMISPSY